MCFNGKPPVLMGNTNESNSNKVSQTDIYQLKSYRIYLATVDYQSTSHRAKS